MSYYKNILIVKNTGIMSMDFIFICLRSLHLFIMVVYKDVNACKSFANLSINNTEVSKFMCRQNLSTDRSRNTV